jgi:hypothetical protein
VYGPERTVLWAVGSFAPTDPIGTNHNLILMLDKPGHGTLYKKIYFLRMSVEEEFFQQIFELFMKIGNEKVFIDILKRLLLLD